MRRNNDLFPAMDKLMLELSGLMTEEFGLDNLQADSPIFSAGLLDSLDVLRLISALEKQYGIKISPMSVTLDMFDSLRGICRVIQENRS